MVADILNVMQVFKSWLWKFNDNKDKDTTV